MQTIENISQEDFIPDIISNSAEMYVLSTERGINGASALFYNPELLKNLSEKINGDLIVLPLSIHEFIVIPAEGTSEDYLLDTVKHVNETMLSLDERLSENVYFYNKEHNVLKALFCEEKEHVASIKNHR